MNIKISFARIEDADALGELDKIANQELKNWSPNSKLDFIKNIKKSKYSIIIAKENNKIVGYLSLRLDKDSQWIWMEDIYVLKILRKEGIARYMIKKLVGYINKKFQSRKLILLTPDRNINIFRNLGFKKTMNFMEYIGEEK